MTTHAPTRSSSTTTATATASTSRRRTVHPTTRRALRRRAAVLEPEPVDARAALDACTAILSDLPGLAREAVLIALADRGLASYRARHMADTGSAALLELETRFTRAALSRSEKTRATAASLARELAELVAFKLVGPPPLGLDPEDVFPDAGLRFPCVWIEIEVVERGERDARVVAGAERAS